jgi:hypothetical protein
VKAPIGYTSLIEHIDSSSGINVKAPGTNDGPGEKHNGGIGIVEWRQEFISGRAFVHKLIVHPNTPIPIAPKNRKAPEKARPQANLLGCGKLYALHR